LGGGELKFKCIRDPLLKSFFGSGVETNLTF